MPLPAAVWCQNWAGLLPGVLSAEHATKHGSLAAMPDLGGPRPAGTGGPALIPLCVSGLENTICRRSAC